jgi:erythromycin esterase
MRQTHATGNPLVLAGFDIYPTGTVSLERPAFFRDLLLPVDASLAMSIYGHDQILIQHWTDPRLVEEHLTDNYTALVTDYDRLNRLLSDSLRVFQDRYSSEDLAAAIETGRTVRSYIRHRAQVFGLIDREPDNERDQQMARTFRNLRDSLFAGRKTIVWAHNVHVYENTPEIQSVRYGTMMGSFLNQWYGKELYTVASFSYRGRIDYGVVTEINITRNESLEAILFQGRMRQFFLATHPDVRKHGDDWLFTPRYQTYIHSTGPYFIRYVPHDQFDAVLFVDTASRPHFLY